MKMQHSVLAFLLGFIISSSLSSPVFAQESSDFGSDNSLNQPPNKPLDIPKGWIKKKLADDTTSFGGVNFINQDTGWLSSTKGFFKTTDGGEIWLPTTISRPGQFSFVNENEFLMIVRDSSYLTRDGGKSWIASYHAIEFPANISRTSKDTFFVMGSEHVSRTTDGGVTWNRRKLGGYLNGMGFSLDGKVGLVVGRLHSWWDPIIYPDPATYQFVTTNGGDSWYEMYSNEKESDAYSVVVFSKSKIIVGGDNYIGINNPTGPPYSWKKVETNAPIESFVRACHVGVNGAIFMGAGGTLMLTTDQGETWSKQIIQHSARLNYIYFIDSLHGFISAEHGTIFQTSDGGLSWVNPTTPPKELLEVQNFPEPFNNITTIHYILPKPQHVDLRVYSIDGRVVSTLLNNELQSAGPHSIPFRAENLPVGIYTYRIETEQYQQTGKLTIVK